MGGKGRTDGISGGVSSGDVGMSELGMVATRGRRMRHINYGGGRGRLSLEFQGGLDGVMVRVSSLDWGWLGPVVVLVVRLFRFWYVCWLVWFQLSP